MWGSNLPVTRTPDAHWMTEARYRGQKVVAVAPDYADNVKFADEWLPARPGHRRRAGDGDGPRRSSRSSSSTGRRRTSPTTSRPTPTCPTWSRLEPRPGRRDLPRRQVPHRRRPAGPRRRRRTPHFKTVLLDARTGEPVVPNGSLGHRFGEAGVGQWNLDLGDVDPLLSLLDAGRRDGAACELPRFDTADGAAGRPAPRRAGAPGRRAPGHHGLRPDARAVRRRPRRAAGGDWRHGVRRRRPRRTPRPGRRRSPASRPRPRPGSPASSRRTPRSPRAAR